MASPSNWSYILYILNYNCVLLLFQQFHDRVIGNTDGTFDNHVLFTCAPRAGLLVTANKVFAKDAGNLSSSLRDRSSQHREFASSFTAEPSPPMRISPPPEAASSARGGSPRGAEARTSELPRPDVEIGERVVWYDDKNDQQLATVKWIGIIRDKPDQYTIGVENVRFISSLIYLLSYYLYGMN